MDYWNTLAGQHVIQEINRNLGKIAGSLETIAAAQKTMAELAKQEQRKNTASRSAFGHEDV